MASELGTELRAESIDRCHRLHPHSREKFIQCLCEKVVGLFRAPPPQYSPTTVTATTPTGTTTLSPPGSTSTSPFVPTDWTRSYSVTAGLCALFLAMCAVIIVLRIMSKRNEPQTRNRVSVSTVPVPDSDPPPYEVVVRLPPSYISREPPPYCEIDIDKYPSPLICPRQPGNARTTAETSITEGVAPGRESTNCGRETAGSGREAASNGREAASCGREAAGSSGEAASSSGEAASNGREAASCGVEASGSHAEARASREAASANTDLAEASTSSGAPPCVAEVTVISELQDTRTASASSASSSDSASR